MTEPETNAVAGWVAVCSYEHLDPERGVAALIGTTAVAIFRLYDGSLHAIANIDPFSGASVLSRGIVGSRGDVPFVASPVYKQGFSLVTGQCMDDAVSVAAYAVRQGTTAVEVAIGPDGEPLSLELLKTDTACSKTSAEVSG